MKSEGNHYNSSFLEAISFPDNQPTYKKGKKVPPTDLCPPVQHIAIDMHVYSETPNVLPQMAKSPLVSA